MNKATKTTFAALLFAALSMQVMAQNGNSYWGRYEGVLLLQPLSGTGRMKILNEYSFVDSAGGRWVVPAGYVSDGASIPKLAWSIVGDPWGADYRNAAVIHDAACDSKNRPWESVHLTFYYAMLAAGVSKYKAKIMYAAVYHFGPRWGPRLERQLAKVTLEYARVLLQSNMIAAEDRSKVADEIAMAERRNEASIFNEGLAAVLGVDPRTMREDALQSLTEVVITAPISNAQATVTMTPEQLNTIIGAVDSLEHTTSDEMARLTSLQSLPIRPPTVYRAP
jgi:hypothetical protein